MPIFNTPTRKAQKAQKADVTPSSRDSISGWLDVLTSMLSLPESQRLQVRDELEDHLRSRVDDLLITGTLEPEAVRIAVAELGETAELAKLISHAHTRANPRRRIMNIALITAAVAGLSIGGISLQNTGGAAVEESGSALVFAESSSTDDEKVHAFDVGTASVSGILNEIGKAFDRSVSFSPGAMSPENAMYINVHSQFAGQFTFDQAIEQFRKLFDNVRYGYNLEITADSVLYQTNDEYERKQIEMRIYPSPVWLSMAGERIDYANSLTNLLKVKHDLRYASIEVIDEAFVVAATPEIHENVLRFSAELNAMIERRQIERKIERDRDRELRRAEAEQEMAKHRAQFAQRIKDAERVVKDLQKEFSTAREALLNSQEKLRALKSNLISEGLAVFSPDSKAGGNSAENDRLLKSINELELEVDENEERYMYLRSRLLDSEYAALFEGLE